MHTHRNNALNKKHWIIEFEIWALLVHQIKILKCICKWMHIDWNPVRVCNYIDENAILPHIYVYLDGNNFAQPINWFIDFSLMILDCLTCLKVQTIESFFSPLKWVLAMTLFSGIPWRIFTFLTPKCLLLVLHRSSMCACKALSIDEFDFMKITLNYLSKWR